MSADAFALRACETFAVPTLEKGSAGADAAIEDKVNARAHNFAFGITNIPGDVCGRRAVARRDIAPGTTVVREKSLLWVPMWHARDAVCHACTAEITPGAPGVLSDAHGMWRFCSERCRAQLAALVEAEAPVTPHVVAAAEAANVDVVLARTSLRLLLTRAVVASQPDAFVSRQARLDASPAPACYVSSLKDYATLAAHARTGATPEMARQLEGLARALWARLAPATQATLAAVLAEDDEEEEGGDRANKDSNKDAAARFVAAFARVAARINANAHALERRDAPFGLGVFPLSALFNHSCAPNCVFVGAGATGAQPSADLLIRCIRPVRAGAELTVNYTALDAARLSRRHALATEKTFLCRCRRCARAPADAEEAVLCRADEALAGVRVAPLTEAEARALDLAAAVRAQVPVAPADGQQQQPPPARIWIEAEPLAEAGEGAASAAAAIADPDAWRAARAEQTVMRAWPPLPDGKGESEPTTTLAAVEATVAAEVAPLVARATELYAADGVPLATVRAAVDAAVLAATRWLSPCHEIFMTLLPVLANVAARQKDAPARLAACEAYAAIAARAFPARFAPLANVQQGLEQAAERMEPLVAAAQAPAAAKRAALAKLRATRVGALAAMVQALEACYGPQEPRVAPAKTKLAALAASAGAKA